MEKEQMEILEDVPIKKARKQPEIPLEVLLQDPDNQLSDIPDDELPDIEID